MFVYVRMCVCVFLAGIGALARIAFCNFPSMRHATTKKTMTTTTTTTQFDVLQIHKYSHTHTRRKEWKRENGKYRDSEREWWYWNSGIAYIHWQNEKKWKPFFPHTHTHTHIHTIIYFVQIYTGAIEKHIMHRELKRTHIDALCLFLCNVHCIALRSFQFIIIIFFSAMQRIFCVA